MIVIASRESRLAMWQAQHVQTLLRQFCPDQPVSILGMTTRGDQILDRSLAKIGGKGLFVKELEQSLLEGRAHLAVHSLKDVPMALPEPLCLAAVLRRETPWDALVSNRYKSFKEMPEGARVGTSSLRRSAQLKAAYPHLQFLPIRGNLDTRLSKLDAGEFEALVLACAGLQRLGLSDRIRSVLSAEESLPAAGQGALGIEILRAETERLKVLQQLHDSSTFACVSAERAVLRHLGGSCETPIAAYAELQGQLLYLRALVASVDGQKIIRAEGHADMTEAESLGQSVAQRLLQLGAKELLGSTTGV
ncbi:MAG: hydroxymethylbilane synthase [Burkholderiales bacterium]